MESELAGKRCLPCRGGVPPLEGEDLESLLTLLPDEWRIVDGHHLARTFPFPDFATALAFVNRVGGIAEEEGHHPDLHLAWGNVEMTVWTHKIDGLVENDFILAAKAERAYPDRVPDRD